MPVSSAQAQLEHWRAVRSVVLARDSHICRDCGDKISRGEADVHHLIPRAAGGSDDPANLVTLCDGCHAAHHPNLQGTLARRSLLVVSAMGSGKSLCFQLPIMLKRGCGFVISPLKALSAPRRKSIAVRMAELILQRSTRVRRTRFCCDLCDGVNVHNFDEIAKWAGQIFAEQR